MQFRILDPQTDGGGVLHITATGTEEIKAVFGVFHWRDESTETLKARVTALESGQYSLICNDKRKWYRNEVELSADWVSPYIEELQKRTGYSGELPELDLIDCVKRITHTHLIESVKLTDGKLSAVIYVKSEDYAGKPAVDRSRWYSRECLGNDFGATPVHSEYIETSAGNYRKNPAWGHYHKPRPALANAAFFNKLFKWWRDNHATDLQKDLLERGLKYGLYSNNWLMTQGHQQCVDLGHGGFRITPNGNGPDSYKFMSWEQFRAVAT